MKKMPVLFVGHGSRMNIVPDNPYTESLRGLARRLPRAEAVCVVSDHDFPMIYAAALRERGEPLRHPCALFRNRSLSMRSFAIGEA